MSTHLKAVFAVTLAAIGVQPARAQADLVFTGGTATFNEMAEGSARNIPISISYGGFKRTFLVHVPARPKPGGTKVLPMLIMLHAAGSDGVGAEAQTGWDRKADEETLLAVFPDALPADPAKPASPRKNPRVWDDGSGRLRDARSAVDDVGFIEAMLDTLSKRFPVDANRIYLTGFANGAAMTFRLVSSPLAARIAAAAPVSGYFYSAAAAAPPRPVPLLLIVGKDDPVNPLDGGVVPRLNGEGTSTKPKIADSITAWAKLEGCTEKPVLISDKNGVRRLAYGPGSDGVEFLYWTVDGMGHQWPGSKTDKRPRSVVGDSSDKLSTDSIWTFLSRHTLALRAESP